MESGDAFYANVKMTFLPKFSSLSFSLNKYHKTIKLSLSPMASMMLGHALKAKARDLLQKFSSHSELPNNCHKIIKISSASLASIMLGDAF